MAAEPDQELLVERREQTLVITINRPHARNAVNHAAATAIAAAMDELDADPALRVGVLTGAGGTFSAGLDLKGFLRGEPREVGTRGFAGFTEAPPNKPLIAAVEGYAFAGGCEMALACDLIVAADDAAFALPEVRRGLIAGSGGLIHLPRLVPPRIAMEHALTGDSMSAVDAHRWGLVNRLTPPGGALAGAIELADRVAANAPLAVRTTKDIINHGPGCADQDAWDRQRRLLETVVASDDAREGSQAFVEKRPPEWRGT
jgi:enoyl-CoA hydratase/carnithine racemase